MMGGTPSGHGTLVPMRPTQLVDEDMRGWLAVGRDGTGWWRYVPAQAREPMTWCPREGVGLAELCDRVGPVRPVVEPLPWDMTLVRTTLHRAGPLAVSTLGHTVSVLSSFHGASALVAALPESWESRALVALGRLAHREWWAGAELVDDHAAAVLGRQLRMWVWGPRGYVDVARALREAFAEVADTLGAGPGDPFGTRWQAWHALCHHELLPERGPEAMGLVYRYLMGTAAQFDPDLYP